MSTSLPNVTPSLCFTKRCFKYSCLFFVVFHVLLFAYLHFTGRSFGFKTTLNEHRSSFSENTISSLFPRRANRAIKRYIIYSCEGHIGAVHCSGWGNRLMGIVASYILANATERTFGILMDNPCNLTDYLIPNAYNWAVPADSLRGLSSTAMDVRNDPSFTKSLRDLNFNDEYPQDVIYIINNQDYHWILLKNKLYRKQLNWLRSLKTARLYKHILNILFKPHRNIQNRLDAFMGTAKKDPQRMLMCAQIRMGRNPTVPWDTQTMNTLKGVEQIWRFFRRHNSTSWIFVTTDSQQVRNQAKSMFGENVLDTKGDIIHMDKAYRGDVCHGMLKLILDQWILINCDILVISVSSFGRIPAFLRGTPFGLYLFSSNAVAPWNPF